MTRALALLVCSLLAALPVVAQETETTEELASAAPTRSALRELIERPGVLAVTRRSVMPAVPLLDGGSVVVSGIGAFEPGMEIQRSLGLRVDLLPAADGTPAIHYLDLHEVEALLRALDTQDGFVAEARADVITEARFVTAEGFGIGVEIRSGTPRYRVRGASDPAWRELNAGPFGALRGHLSGARDRLFNAP